MHRISSKGNRNRAVLTAAVAWLAIDGPAAARDWYVDPDRGSESFDGLAPGPAGANRGPVKTIHRALKYAGAGDTVHLTPRAEPYRESPVFHDRNFPADKPLTLDGHGATITGAEPVDMTTWEQTSPGLFRKQGLLRTDDAVIGRYFFRFDGRMQHMGRTSKGPSAALKSPEALLPGEWTFVKTDDAFYVRLDPAKRPSGYRIEAPLRSAGVQISGRNENIVIRNLHTQHVYNDGFNIHGYCRGVRLENVSAVECGDDGISAHDDCRIVVDGFTSIGNSTGFCHTNDSWSDSRRVHIRDCLGFDVFVLDGGRHRLTDSLIFASAAASVVVVGPQRTEPDSTGRCVLDIANTAIVRRGTTDVCKFQVGSEVRIVNSTLAGFNVSALGSLFEIRRSVVAGSGIAGEGAREIVVGRDTAFAAEANCYDLACLRIGDRLLTSRSTRDDFEAANDRHSTWRSVRFREPFDGTPLEPVVIEETRIGVDTRSLPKP